MSFVWSYGVYRCEAGLGFPVLAGSLVHLADSGRTSRAYKGVHTQADPFLIADDDYLYVLYEVQCRGSHGFLAADRSADGVHWETLGAFLRQPFHLSYPFPFRDPLSGALYLLPESKEAGEVALYHFNLKNLRAEKLKVLLQGRFFDSSIHFHNGTYFLFTTTEDYELRIYQSNSLVEGDWTLHPASPITTDKAISRNAGGLIQAGDHLYRLAQDCSVHYGEKLHVLKVQTLSSLAYAETLVASDLIIHEPAGTWKPIRRHHLSFAHYRGQLYAAIDGMHAQSTLARIAKALF